MTVEPCTYYKYVQVELNPEKQLKIKDRFFLNRVNNSANQMISGNSKGVNNRHIQFGSITSLERAVMDTVLTWLPIGNVLLKLGHKQKKSLKYF